MFRIFYLQILAVVFDTNHWEVESSEIEIDEIVSVISFKSLKETSIT